MITSNKHNPSTAIVVVPSFSPEQVKQARLWLITTGYPVSKRGRVAVHLLNLWHDMGQPIITVPEVAKPKQHKLGQWQGPKMFYSIQDRTYCKRWIAERDSVELPSHVKHVDLEEWRQAGSIELTHADDIAATIEYQAHDKLGRYNASARRQMVDVMRVDMPGGRGRPATISYLESSTLNLSQVRVHRIITSGGAIHSVSWDREAEAYVIVWESKSDQRAVMVSLLETIAQYRAITDAAGLDTSMVGQVEDMPDSDADTLD